MFDIKTLLSPPRLWWALAGVGCVLALALWPTRAEPVALIAAMMGGLIRDAKREQRRAAERGEQLDGGEARGTAQTAREVEEARAEGEKEARAWLDQ